MKTVTRLVKEALSWLLTVQEVTARPQQLSEHDKAIIVEACDEAVWKLLAADGIHPEAEMSTSETRVISGFESWIKFNYPELYEEWEVEACEYLSLAEWIAQLHWLVSQEKEPSR